jgi:1-acyl-sn-glycerol-3-phosphate acyltransferase
LGLHITQKGEIAPGALIVSNHLSYIDIFVISACRSVVFVAKQEVKDWPWGGIIADCGGTIYIQRGRASDLSRVREKICAAVESGVPAVLFLEGTTTDGTHVLPFHPGLLQPAVDSNWKVIPCTVNYRVAETGTPDGVSWHSDMTFLPHLMEFLLYSRTEVIVEFGPAVQADSRKHLALVLHKEISRKLMESREALHIAPKPATISHTQLT